MSEFLINQRNCKVWYDLKSTVMDVENNIKWKIIHQNQSQFWIRAHREDGPAIIWPDEKEEYFVNGLRHCEYGPDIIWPYGEISFYLNDKYHSFNRWCKILDKTEEEITFLKLKWNIL